MTEDFCPFESQTAEAARTGQWSVELSGHVDACRQCEETRALASLMGRAADHFGRNEPAPDPTLTWLKSQLTGRNEDEKRERRMRIWSHGIAGFAATLTGWAVLQWIPPVFALTFETLAATGAAMLLTLVILYFGAVRPLQDANR